MTLDRNCVSVVVPLYNEQDTLRELWQRLQASLAALPFETREILLVSDGSTDGSEEIIADLVHRHAEAKGVFLTRNFGHQAAVSIGLAESDRFGGGGDGRGPAGSAGSAASAWSLGSKRGPTWPTAFARTAKRRPSVPRPTTSSIVCCTCVAECRMPLDAGDFCCMRREVVEAIVRLPERNRFVRGLRAWVGYRQVGVEYERDCAVRGQTEIHTAEPARPGL